MLNKDQKEVIKKISMISGLSEEIVKEVWEKFIFEELCQIAQNPHDPHIIHIPYFGNVLIRLDGETENDIVCLISLSDYFKNLLLDLKKNKIDNFSKIMKDQFAEVLKELIGEEEKENFEKIIHF